MQRTIGEKAVDRHVAPFIAVNPHADVQHLWISSLQVDDYVERERVSLYVCERERKRERARVNRKEAKVLSVGKT